MSKLDEMQHHFEKEADRSREDKTISEQMRIARSAKSAAQVAAIAVVISAMAAIISIWFAWKNH
jgi:hypothetical protein